MNSRGRPWLRSPLALADKFFRKRAWLVAAAALSFMLNVAARFRSDWLGDVTTTRLDWWLIRAVVMLMIVATGGGLLIRPGVRGLEVITR